MNATVVILSDLLNQRIIAGFAPLTANANLSLISALGLFNGQFLFVLKFFGEVLLVFLFGGIIGQLLHLDRVEKSDSHTNS